MTTFNPDEYLLPIQYVTGAATARDAGLVMSYRYASVVMDRTNGSPCTTLTEAIRWNEMEAKDALESSPEKTFRLALVEALRSISTYDSVFTYSDELVRLRNRALHPGAE